MMMHGLANFKNKTVFFLINIVVLEHVSINGRISLGNKAF
jgi:hypothetical protein